MWFPGKYCEDCLECVSDGDGSCLDNHKFEPIRTVNYWWKDYQRHKNDSG